MSVTDVKSISKAIAHLSVTKTPISERSLADRAVSSPPLALAIARGTQTTETLSAQGCTAPERYSGVTLATITARDGSAHLYLMIGVFYTELMPIEEKEFLALNQPYHKPDQDFAFAIFSVDEFIQDVCVAGQYNLFWPRTNKFYTIPAWYREAIPNALAALRGIKAA